jgi:hypothetical protein
MVHVYIHSNIAVVFGAQGLGHLLLRRYNAFYSQYILSQFVTPCLMSGVKVLFRVALVMLKYSLNKASVMKQCPTMYETVDVLRHLQPGITDENFLIPQVNCYR